MGVGREPTLSAHTEHLQCRAQSLQWPTVCGSAGPQGTRAIQLGQFNRAVAPREQWVQRGVLLAPALLAQREREVLVREGLNDQRCPVTIKISIYRFRHGPNSPQGKRQNRGHREIKKPSIKFNPK